MPDLFIPSDGSVYPEAYSESPPPFEEESDFAQLKMPPHSVEAEQSVLGGLMIANESWDSVADVVGEGDFFRPEHRKIFAQMTRLVTLELPIDVVTLAEELAKAGQLEQVGGAAYLAEIANNTPSVVNIRAYAQAVRERATFRSLISAANAIADSSFNPEGRNSDEILDEAERAIMQISEERPKTGGLTPINPLLKSAVDKIDELFSNEDAVTGLTTGFEKLDEMTSGLQNSDLIIVAARPSMGKTTFAMNLVENALMKSEQPILVFSMEMPANQLMMRMLSSVGRIDQTRIRTGRLEEEDWPKLSSAVTKLKDKLLFIDDTPALTPTEVRSRARKIVREHGSVGMIMLDYLQLMKVAGTASEGRTAEISEISRSLKGIAKEFECPVVALSQLNRALEQRPNKRPINSDLRESGAIEQDADVIMFIYRDEVYNEESADKGMAEIIIGKQRNGPIGTARLSFVGKHTRFENLAFGYEQADEY
ncbi:MULTISPECIES: replicative DNA helicase [Zhongshania]|jgi:replicative DNA helicase|uniref:Replicative DNA helicase n=3 Tax=Zhongshania TaxID=1434050 RepID=A0A127M2U4_9GAMM|nr:MULTISPECIES: replicative DNA helicase [Zhongshania]AMO67548.1 replicative DNA helicase [Zhongshania aliphaticivorans]EIF44997.1 replicative DNA helicase [gamma proteobacterium BDW918]MBB5188559.1 replicative DNA helicase [Zhongshania antarctica]|tara:strand:- start:127384 stop:128826 length:1443 start_codon:yes stop_codon:yes gene_type:complete